MICITQCCSQYCSPRVSGCVTETCQSYDSMKLAKTPMAVSLLLEELHALHHSMLCTLLLSLEHSQLVLRKINEFLYFFKQCKSKRLVGGSNPAPKGPLERVISVRLRRRLVVGFGKQCHCRQEPPACDTVDHRNFVVVSFVGSPIVSIESS